MFALVGLVIIPYIDFAFATQFGRPTSDISNDGGWTDTSAGGNLFDELDETASDDDTTKVTSPNKPSTTQTFEVKFGSMNDPVSSTGHLYKYSANKPQGAQTTTIHCDLYQGTSLIKLGATNTISSATYTTFTENLSGGQADSITNYADLRVRCVPSTGGGGGQPSVLQVSWIEMQTPDATATHNIIVSETNNGSDSHTISKIVSIAVSETNNGSDSSSVINAGTVHNIIVSETNEGSDSHTTIRTIPITVSETNEGSDLSSVSAGAIHNIIVSEENQGSDSSITGIVESFAPSGKYIWFNISPPTDTRLGGVYAFQCPAGQYIYAINSDGTVSCSVP